MSVYLELNHSFTFQEDVAHMHYIMYNIMHCVLMYWQFKSPCSTLGFLNLLSPRRASSNSIMLPSQHHLQALVTGRGKLQDPVEVGGLELKDLRKWLIAVSPQVSHGDKMIHNFFLFKVFIILSVLSRLLQFMQMFVASRKCLIVSSFHLFSC